MTKRRFHPKKKPPPPRVDKYAPQTSYRECFNRDGTPKECFDQQRAVLIADTHGMNAYCCSYCGRWHVGNPSARRRHESRP